MIYAVTQLRGKKGGLFRRLGRDKRARDAVRPPDPRAAELIYRKWVRAFWSLWAHSVLSELDSDRPDFARRFADLIGASGYQSMLQRAGSSVTQTVANYMGSIFKKGTTPTRVRLDADYEPVARLRPFQNAEQQALIDQWRIENLRLITNAGDDHVAELAEAFKAAQEQGLSRQELIDTVKKVLKTGEDRAKLIASDQTTKFNGTIQAVQQQAAGITEFVWSTSKDGAVRPTHRELEGKTFSWAVGAPDGPNMVLPGQPVRCRCQAIPKIPLFDDIDNPVEAPETPDPVPSAVQEINAIGLRNTNYLRSGMRPESLAFARQRYEGATPEEAQELALTLPEPVRVHVRPGELPELNDGRHRMTAAIEAGATHILAKVVQYGSRGGQKAVAIRPVKL